MQIGRIQDCCHHQVKWEWMSLSQIELVWVTVRVEIECFWVNLREENKVSESIMGEFKMTAIIKLSQNEWVKFFFVQMVGTNLGKCEAVWENKLRWLNPRWPNSRWQYSWWLPSSSWVRMNEWSFFVQMVGTNLGKCESVWEDKLRWMNQICQIQNGSIQDGCHHLVKWEWMSLSQIELVWVRVRMEWECFWVNLREDNKVSESKMAVSESNGRIQDGCHHQVESEWMSEVFLCKWWEPILASVSQFERTN